MRYRNIILTVAIALIAVLATFTQTAHAQTDNEPAGFKNVTLWINPEYDQPSLLVMLQGQITGATPPVEIRFLVPTEAEMYSAGSMDAQNNYSGGPPNRQTSQIPGWDEISYQLKTDTFRVEYYNPVITSAPNKSIAYDFRFLYPISNLSVIAQEPLKSSNYSIIDSGDNTPGGITGTVDGFKVHNFSYNNLTPGTPIHFDISYTKTDPNPSISGPNTTSGGSSPIEWILIATGAIVLAGIALYIFKYRLKPGYFRKTARARISQTTIHSAGQYKARFCNQCGSPLGKSSNFCSNCGYKLKNHR